MTEQGIPKTRVSSLGFVELELPVARAVEVLAEEGTISSGFHEQLNQRWAIVFRGVVTPRVAAAAQRAGLGVSFREAPKGTGQYFTDTSLPNVGRDEIKKATAIFNRFAELYGQGGEKMTEEYHLHHSPITPHCEAVLAKPPECVDFRGIRSWVLCKSWDIMEKEKRTKLPVGEAWREARKLCVRE